MSDKPENPPDAKHTPGPWEVIGTDPAEGGDWFWIKAQPSPVLRGFTKDIGVVNGSQSDAVQQANARLIAAAPELLALAYQYRSDLIHPVAPDSRERRLAMIDALISKATGQ